MNTAESSLISNYWQESSKEMTTDEDIHNMTTHSRHAHSLHFNKTMLKSTFLDEKYNNTD